MEEPALRCGRPAKNNRARNEHFSLIGTSGRARGSGCGRKLIPEVRKNPVIPAPPVGNAMETERERERERETLACDSFY